MGAGNIPPEYREILERVEALENIVGISDHHSRTSLDLSDDEISISSVSEVVVAPKAYLRMAEHALRYARHAVPRQNWVEVIGLLTGSVMNADTPKEQVQISEYWPVGHGDAVSVNIMDAEPVMHIIKEKKNDEFIIGWAHSHPSYSPFLSDDDVATQMRYQALWEKSIAVVIDPLMINQESYGFEIFRLSANRREYYELNYEVDGLSTEAAFEAVKIIAESL